MTTQTIDMSLPEVMDKRFESEKYKNQAEDDWVEPSKEEKQVSRPKSRLGLQNTQVGKNDYFLESLQDQQARKSSGHSKLWKKCSPVTPRAGSGGPTQCSISPRGRAHQSGHKSA